MKRFLAFLLILLLSFSWYSCKKTEEVKKNITIIDQAGRTVQLEKAANKVVSCYYVTTYAMLALGQGEKLVGIEKKADTRPIYAMTNPGLLELPAVGSLKEIDVEKIASLQPDLVILPKKLTDSAKTLEDLGISTLVVNPETEDDLRKMLQLIGQACGCEEKANALIDFSDKKLDDFAEPAQKPSVLFLSNSDYLSVAPKNMYQSDVISLAGGENAFQDSTGTYWEQLSYEKILKLNPDYLVIPSGASYTMEDLKKDQTLAELQAVQNGNVVAIPNVFEEWDSPIPSGVLGVLWLRTVLHSESYGMESFKEDVIEFYQTFYGFTPTEEQIHSLE